MASGLFGNKARKRTLVFTFTTQLFRESMLIKRNIYRDKFVHKIEKEMWKLQYKFFLSQRNIGMRDYIKNMYIHIHITKSQLICV